jgi:hypothetical protein
MGRSLIWDDDFVLTTYFTYLSLFTGYNWWRYHQNSVYEEKKNEDVLKNPVFIEWAKATNFEPFDHKKGRKRIALISFFTILFNAIMITLQILIEGF